jgi:hypothetical protein
LAVEWLAVSLVASAVLTLLLNFALRVFPSMGAHITRAVAEWTSRTTDSGTSNERRVRVFVPWKAMIVGSLLLTVLINLIRWLR